MLARLYWIVDPASAVPALLWEVDAEGWMCGGGGSAGDGESQRRRETNQRIRLKASIDNAGFLSSCSSSSLSSLLWVIFVFYPHVLFV